MDLNSTYPFLESMGAALLKSIDINLLLDILVSFKIDIGPEPLGGVTWSQADPKGILKLGYRYIMWGLILSS